MNGLGKLGYHPGPAFMRAFAAQVANEVEAFSSQVCVCMCAFLDVCG